MKKKKIVVEKNELKIDFLDKIKRKYASFYLELTQKRKFIFK